MPIWCTSTVTHLANGTTTTTNPDNVKCKKLADAGAVRIRWPAGRRTDKRRGDKQGARDKNAQRRPAGSKVCCMHSTTNSEYGDSRATIFLKGPLEMSMMI